MQITDSSFLLYSTFVIDAGHGFNKMKLLRNRGDIQIKPMRDDIAKLLETGLEATVRILEDAMLGSTFKVEHIIREENMMAALKILELFCELIFVHLPIIETQGLMEKSLLQFQFTKGDVLSPLKRKICVGSRKGVEVFSIS
ncbi:Vacuolar protein sorting-associated protein Ist1 - like 10 [Theobroma cacao]|nr:Vacuolar protein sorting-associated protein Ist1 - like 10 [Theobroma cacao]